MRILWLARDKRKESLDSVPQIKGFTSTISTWRHKQSYFTSYFAAKHLLPAPYPDTAIRLFN